MAGGGLTALMGLGHGLGGVGSALTRQREREYKDRVLAQQAAQERERTVLDRERLAENKRQFDEGRTTDVSALLQFMPADFAPELRAKIAAGESFKVPTAAVPAVLAQVEKQSERARQAREGADFGTALTEAATTTSPGYSAAPGSTFTAPNEERSMFELGETRTVDPQIAKLAKVAPFFTPQDRSDVIKSLAGATAEKNKLIATEHPIYDPASKTWIEPPKGPAGAPFTAPPDYRPTYRENAKGQVETTWNPPPEMSSSLRAISDGITAMYGFQPGSPAHKIMLGESAKFIPVAAGGEVHTGLGAMGSLAQSLKERGVSGEAPAGGAPTGGTAPGGAGAPTGSTPVIRGPVPPVPEGISKDIMSIARTRAAAQEVMQTLQDPEVKSYIGPYGQYKAWVQGKAPYESAGQIPASVVKLRRNLRTVQNYTIKLITGAQMGEAEATRIKAELPDLGQQENEFADNMSATLENHQYMERILVDLALRGDQKQKALALGIAKELSIPIPGTGPPGTGAQVIPDRGAAETAPTKTPQTQTRIRVRDPKTGKTGTLAPGAPVPPGLEVIQ